MNAKKLIPAVLIFFVGLVFAPGFLLSLPVFVWAMRNEGDPLFWTVYLFVLPLLLVFLAPTVPGMDAGPWISVLFPLTALPVLAHGTSKVKERERENEIKRLSRSVAMLESIRWDENQTGSLCSECRNSKSNKPYTGKEDELSCTVFKTTVKPGVVSCDHFSQK